MRPGRPEPRPAGTPGVPVSRPDLFQLQLLGLQLLLQLGFPFVVSLQLLEDVVQLRRLLLQLFLRAFLYLSDAFL